MSMERNVKVGLAVAFLSFVYNNVAMVITCVIMMVLGIIVCILRLRVSTRLQIG